MCKVWGCLVKISYGTKFNLVNWFIIFCQFLYGEYHGYGSNSKKESHMLFLHHNVGMLH